jgi:hypothetical protein
MKDIVLRFCEATAEGGIWRPPLQKRFPQVFRGKERKTPGAVAHDVFTLSSDAKEHEGAAAFEPINTLRADERTSISVRWHASMEAARGYLTGVRDTRGDKSFVIYRSDAGLFTLVETPTRSWWASPMIVYGASFETQTTEHGFGSWKLGIGSDADTADVKMKRDLDRRV